MTSALHFVLPLIAVVLVGCTTGSEFPGPQKLVKGITTHQQVLAEYGPPRREVQGTNGARLLQYFTHHHVRLGDYPTDFGSLFSRALDVLIAPNGVVSNFHHYTSRHEVPIRDDYAQSGPFITEEKLSRIVPGKTTQAELTELFGKPYVEHLHLNNGLVLVWLHARYRPGVKQTYTFLETVLDANNTVVNHRTNSTSYYAPLIYGTNDGDTSGVVFSPAWITPPPSLAEPTRSR